jgi:hypothetical protein
MRLRGTLKEAEHEVLQVCADSRGYVDIAAAAFYEMGEIRLRMGNYEGAEEAFTRLTNEAETGSRPSAPASDPREDRRCREPDDAALAGSLRAPGPCASAAVADSIARCRRPEGARASVDELESIASQFGSPAFEAAAAQARGSLDVASREFEGVHQPASGTSLLVGGQPSAEAAMTRMLRQRLSWNGGRSQR